ncbi:MAG: DMT family transporter [Pseudomonadota bacterium]
MKSYLTGLKSTANGGARRKDHAIGVMLVVIAAITYSSAGLFTKGVAAGSWEVIFWRGVFAAGFTTAWTYWLGALRPNFIGIGQSGWAVAIIGALGSAAFIPAFKLTSIANVSLIYAVAPLFASLLAWWFIAERLSARTALGCLGALLGVGVIVSGSIRDISLYGDLLAVGMTVAMASIMVIYRARPQTPAAGPAVLQSILLLPVALMLGSPFAIPWGEIAVLAAFGLLFAIASVTLAEGAKRIPSGQTALLSALETPLAPILAFVLLAEIPNGATLVGGVIVAVAVLSAIRDRPSTD